MKYFFYIILMSLTLACSSTENDTKLSEGAGKIVFDEPIHDFGELTEGDVVNHTYSFTNKGSSPITILDVKVSCGCTVASKPEKPIGVGQRGEISISFNSKGKVGTNSKSIGVISNAKNAQEVLKFTALVKGSTVKKDIQ